jgi:hypothetical protein
MMVGKRHKVESTVARDNERKIYAGSAGQSGFMHIYHICAFVALSVNYMMLLLCHSPYLKLIHNSIDDRSSRTQWEAMMKSL